MSIDEPTFQALLGMGIEVQVARKAATMFTKADAAVEWCFGDGLGVSRSILPLPYKSDKAVDTRAR
jgi:uncharacterized UBP type Zn finger protein